MTKTAFDDAKTLPIKIGAQRAGRTWLNADSRTCCLTDDVHKEDTIRRAFFCWDRKKEKQLSCQRRLFPNVMWWACISKTRAAHFERDAGQDCTFPRRRFADSSDIEYVANGQFAQQIIKDAKPLYGLCDRRRFEKWHPRRPCSLPTQVSVAYHDCAFSNRYRRCLDSCAILTTGLPGLEFPTAVVHEGRLRCAAPDDQPVFFLITV